MAIVKPTLATPSLSGKIGGVIYATQPDGTVIACGVGKRKAPFTEGEKRGQERMKLAHQYLRGAMADPAVRTAYEEARRINTVAEIDLSGYTGRTPTRSRFARRTTIGSKA